MGAAEKRAEKVAENRARMPETARTVDEFREAFGPGCRVLWAREGETYFEASAAVGPQRSMNVDQWQRFVETGELPDGVKL